ncbi:MAG: hypothetical protein QOK13_1431, partial [Gaiellaceae bacterium]|nr:hypothetical protein [Gaiellaceae bacterium]
NALAGCRAVALAVAVRPAEAAAA